jgi:hypothetical protein
MPSSYQNFKPTVMHDKTVLTLETQIFDATKEVPWFETCRIVFQLLHFLCQCASLYLTPISIFWDITLYSPLSGMPSNLLAGYFKLYRKQVGNGRMDLSSHWLTVGQNETLASHTTTERTSRRQE